MTAKTKNHSLTKRHSRRDAADVASPRLFGDAWADMVDFGRRYVSPVSHVFDLSEVQDLRRFDPEVSMPDRPVRWFTPRTVSGGRSRLQVARKRVVSGRGAVFTGLPSSWYRIGFENPSRVVLCVRRKIRREVLHARGVAGRSRSRFKPSRRNWASSISC